MSSAMVTTVVNSTAGLSSPTGLILSSSADLFVSDNAKHNIRKISPTGLMTVYAGIGVSGFLDGPRTSARFNGLSGLAIDSAGTIYVADTNNNRIRKISTLGTYYSCTDHFF